MIRGKKYISDSECENIFREIGPVYNANTPENHPVVFTSDRDYMTAMSIFGICARMYRNIRIFAFQLMSNHIHFVIGGNEDVIHDFFDYYVSRLDKYFEGRVDFSEFKLKCFAINDLSYFRNAIVYNNRNGFVVNDHFTPFSYPWGSSGYFFMPMARRYSALAGKAIGNTQLRTLMHTRNCDALKDLKMVDGFVSPLEFCDIDTAESIFRDAKQYFYLISRKVEAYAEVAKSIGESLYFNDNDLYLAALKLAQELYGTKDLKTLTVVQKMETARRLHYDYNAGDKQLQRILKIGSDVLKAMF